MWDKIRKYMRQNHIIENNDHIIIGLSGGADSVCLLRFLMEISKEYNLFLAAVHVNHMIRDEGAKRDERFVEELCKKYEIPLCSYQIDVKQYALEKKCSLEEAGRIVRYQCFVKAAGEKKCEKIALAHHENDLAETILFRMIRGTGIEGLCAMKPVNGKFIRPLLGVTREDILNILNQLGQDYVEDETNSELEYSRNYIRKLIMPKLIKMNGQATGHIARLAKESEELFRYLAPIIREAVCDCVKRDEKGSVLSLKSYVMYPEYIQKNIIRQMIYEESGHKKDIGAIHIDVMTDLINGPEGKQVSLPYQLIAVKEKDFIILRTKIKIEQESGAGVEEKEIVITRDMISNGYLMHPGGDIQIDFTFVSPEFVDYQNNDCIKYFDYDKIKNNMCIRHRKDGDYFVMDKNKHRKTLRRYFIDEKMPSAQRKSQLLLADGSHIMWIIGGRMSEEYKVTKDTKCVLKMQILHIP